MVLFSTRFEKLDTQVKQNSEVNVNAQQVIQNITYNIQDSAISGDINVNKHSKGE